LQAWPAAMNANRPNLPESSDVVIIGAGIAGIAAAWFLNKSGLRVSVCEKGIVAGEQSSRNWGWCRQQGRDQAELPIVIESLRLWQQIADELETDIGFRREGSLYLCENDAEMANPPKWPTTIASCRSRRVTDWKPAVSTANSSKPW
jgi:glycine/D-amino acid oxidase-like deaminating enzyme